MVDEATYPAELEGDVVLRTGQRIRVRPIRPADERRLVDLYDRLSEHSAYQRFFSAMRRLPPDWAHFLANVDYRRRLALVAEDPTAPDGALVGVARYESRADDDAAEVALVVQDGWQNLGLGSRLFRALLEAATARGIHRFRAYVLADNRRMLHLIGRLTDVQQRGRDGSVVELTFGLRA
jgi:RimJ/RimL family protein N-acetyltransferase